MGPPNNVTIAPWILTSADYLVNTASSDGKPFLPDALCHIPDPEYLCIWLRSNRLFLQTNFTKPLSSTPRSLESLRDRGVP